MYGVKHDSTDGCRWVKVDPSREPAPGQCRKLLSHRLQPQQRNLPRKLEHKAVEEIGDQKSVLEPSNELPAAGQVEQVLAANKGGTGRKMHRLLGEGEAGWVLESRPVVSF